MSARSRQVGGGLAEGAGALISSWRGFLAGARRAHGLKTRATGVVLGAVLVAMCAVGIAETGAPQPASAPATTRSAWPTQGTGQAGCVRPECHAEIRAHEVVHGPVAVHACDACHELMDADAHRWTVRREGAALCTYCHEFDLSKMPVVHKPVKLGECLGCHDPHRGLTHSLTREDSSAALCGRCHESIAKDKTFLHSPVAQKECDSCHSPHAARFGNLLDKVGTDLCLTCHEGFESSMTKAKFTHEAMKEGCEKCHDAHGSNQPMALAAPLVELCIGCHEPVYEQAVSSRFGHSAVLEDRACLNCHTAHGGDLARLLSDLPIKTCMGCHDKPVKTRRGDTVAAATEVLEAKALKHGPIKDGLCGGCHTAHGSEQPLLLSKAYSSSYYQKFSPEAFALCFSCHKAELVEETTAIATGFRNGDRNLHSVHVKGVRGQSCRICHEPHASVNVRNIRQLVQYGVWKMPINLRKTGTGGSCAPGCHVSYAYDRERPVETHVATRPAMSVARAQTAPVQMQWSGKDMTGTGVTVPDERRPSVLVLLRGTVEEDRQVVGLLAATGGELEKAQVLLILEGARAEERAAHIALEPSANWPIVADEEGELARLLGVRAWPATIIVGPDGTEVARIGGAVESLPLRLGAYLARGSGRRELGAVEPALAVVGDEPARQAGRAMRIADRYLAVGDAFRAHQVLMEAMKSNPDSAALRVELARALIALNRDDEALAVLSKLSSDAAAGGEVGILRARALLAGNKLAEAREALLESAKENPGSAEAHYLLGRVYEREENWQAAARAYRQAREMEGAQRK